MRSTIVTIALVLAAAIMPASAQAHTILLGKNSEAKRARICENTHFTVRDFRRYIHTVYRRDKISRKSHRRIRLMHICQGGFGDYQARKRVGQIHRNHYQARKERLAAARAQSGGAGGILAAIRACESGGNYSANTGNGFYGAYQFALRTWGAYGGTGMPHLASPTVQDRIAMNLYRAVGVHTSASWPNCP